MIAAGGTLGIMIPPSTVFAVYGLITEQDVGKLFIAGILPGLLAVAMYMITITIIGHARPGFLPAGDRAAPGRSASPRCKDIWATLLLFAFVIGGIYGGLFTATEAAGAGAGGAFIIGVAARTAVAARTSCRSLLETTRTTAAVFTVLIGAILFGYFLTVTQTPQKVTDVPHRARHRPLRRARADHADVSGARMPHGRARHDHPHGADHLSR